MALNYYTIAQALGGKLVPGRRARFGALAKTQACGDALRLQARPETKVILTLKDERKLVDAFEASRKGNPPDRLLWDPSFARRFHKTARELGVHAPASTLTRGLIRIRKNPRRYGEYGIVISPSTAKATQIKISSKYFHALEFALVRLRYRHGASIDDILLDKKLGDEYVELAHQMAPALNEKQLRLGALNIRKARHLKKSQMTLFDQLDVDRIEPAIREVGTFSQIDVKALPESSGLIEVTEGSRPLYIVNGGNLRDVARELVEGPAFKLMANHFWDANPAKLNLAFLTGTTYEDVVLKKWQLKLIAERQPVFNWPVKPAA